MVFQVLRTNRIAIVQRCPLNLEEDLAYGTLVSSLVNKLIKVNIQFVRDEFKPESPFNLSHAHAPSSFRSRESL